MEKSKSELDQYLENLAFQFQLDRKQISGYFRKHGEEKATKRLEAFYQIVVNRQEYPSASELENVLEVATGFVAENKESLVKTGSASGVFAGPQFIRNVVERCFRLDVDRQEVVLGISISEPGDIREKRRHYVGYLVENLSQLPSTYWNEMSDLDADFGLALRIDDFPYENALAPLVRYESSCLATYPRVSIGGFADVTTMIARSGPEILHGKYAKLQEAFEEIIIPKKHTYHSLYFQLLSLFSDVDGLDELAFEILEQDVPGNRVQIFTGFNEYLASTVSVSSSKQKTSPQSRKPSKRSMGSYEVRGRQIYYGSRKVCDLTPSQQIMYDALFKKGAMSVGDIFAAVKRIQSLKNDGRIKALGEFQYRVSAEKIRSNWFAGKEGACLWGTLFKVYQDSDGKEHIDLDFSSRPVKK